MINKKVLAIILGGGQGTRLSPLTDQRSKPAVSIAGKYRLVDIPISNCIHCDIKRMFVLTQFNSASLNRHIKNTYVFSTFSDAFVDILAAEQTPDNKTWYQGTADAVRQSMYQLLNHEFEYALILSGDQLYKMDFNEMIDAHVNKGADISIATIPVKSKEATQFGILKTDEHSFISSFIEKPSLEKLSGWESEVSLEMQKEERNYLASMGIYIFNKQLLIDTLSNTDTIDFGKEIIPQSITKNKVLAYQYEGYWTDIGNVPAFFEANISLTDDVPKFDLFNKNNSVLTRPRILPPSKISGTRLDKSMIAEGCIINAKEIERSVIGIRSRIGKDTSIKNTYMIGANSYQDMQELDKDYEEGIPSIGVGDRCYINNTILDKDVRIGNDVVINGGAHLEDTEQDVYVIREGVVVIKKGTVIPDGFKL
ncbi:glucose-1-phosphate adenylyltransferase [Aquimarina muelleri]|uniref:Glucose-1-phosphate adenylyltransferase n=1 Tax=Aquimarina muelleri TaxID=279356 RepID=A0A918JU23_9FLAO|nr:glucose-1-phosphate adenylyltransferase [Aquimarina muelleri]MCX2763055.1 glucose-1-phosphate adenylyltransferase [Aquimarina muelleri]GGX03129.1 glucose-1-phosphate adenylyltransferase [Aquimarina muelleri]